MLAVSFNENFVRFGQLVQADEQLTIETLQKKPLPFVFVPAMLCEHDLVQRLESIFKEIIDTLPVPERNLALSLGTEWFDFVVNFTESNLEGEELTTLLEHNEHLRLGDWYQSKFIQHYPLKYALRDQQAFLTVSYYKELGKVLHQATQSVGLNIKVFDVNLFTAARTIASTNPDLNNQHWGIWFVTPKRQELLLVAANEFEQYLEFEFTDAENYQINRFANPDQRGAEIVAQINDLRTYRGDEITLLDRLFFFSYDVTEEFFNILLTFELPNFICFDPVRFFKPVDLYLGDGDGSGAMSQFVDVLGLLARFMPGVQK